jgi:hypothetical protein
MLLLIVPSHWKGIAMKKQYTIPVAGDHSETHEAILLYLYNNPERPHSTGFRARR